MGNWHVVFSDQIVQHRRAYPRDESRQSFVSHKGRSPQLRAGGVHGSSVCDDPNTTGCVSLSLKRVPKEHMGESPHDWFQVHASPVFCYPVFLFPVRGGSHWCWGPRGHAHRGSTPRASCTQPIVTYEDVDTRTRQTRTQGSDLRNWFSCSAKGKHHLGVRGRLPCTMSCRGSTWLRWFRGTVLRMSRHRESYSGPASTWVLNEARGKYMFRISWIVQINLL